MYEKGENNELHLNDMYIKDIETIINIDLLENNYYKCSICIPISLIHVDKETLINFDYNILLSECYRYHRMDIIS